MRQSQNRIASLHLEKNQQPASAKPKCGKTIVATASLINKPTLFFGIH